MRVVDAIDKMWFIDERTGNLFADFSRTAEPGSQYTSLTIIASDGLETSTSSVTVRWGNLGEVETPMESHLQDSVRVGVPFRVRCRLLFERLGRQHDRRERTRAMRLPQILVHGGVPLRIRLFPAPDGMRRIVRPVPEIRKGVTPR